MLLAILEDNMSNIIESNSKIAIQANTDAIKVPPLYQILLNIKMLVLITRNIKFVSVNIYANQLADKIARRVHPCTTEIVFVHQLLLLVFLF